EDDDARDWVDFYDESMKAVITSWRKAWGEELPFFQVELAPFEGVGVTGAKRYDVLRHQQYKATSELDHAYDVCILDVGERYNIHPRRKEKVGRRLAHLAMKYVYGDTSLVADMPIVKEAKRVEDTIEIYFDHCAGGLEERLSLKDVLKVTQDGNPMDYSYELKGDTLVLQGDFKAKTLIQYCEGNFVEASLFNREDNPVFGFTLEV
ncbi:MAG: hypothetical protein HUJ56_01735, partial [Erysipelotrichaceae bacterium]|nr:hypothetical protein [Erysipelotrichaceae bacterium]